MSEAVSNILGEYMLKGWIMTNNTCPTCHATPLMRSPSREPTQTTFCAQCEGAPGSKKERPKPPSLTSPSSVSRSEASPASNGSSPPTELSSDLSSPVFATVPDTPAIMARRQQSDHASAEIGRRLLQGWTMLAEECPNPRCYGVPLVRAPKSTGSTTQECVVCGGTYGGPLDPLNKGSSATDLHSNLLEKPSNTLDYTKPLVLSSDPTSTLYAQLTKNSSSQHLTRSPKRLETFIDKPQNARGRLERSTHALEAAFDKLTQQLIVDTTKDSHLDPVVSGNTAEAMNKLASALTQVKRNMS